MNKRGKFCLTFIVSYAGIVGSIWGVLEASTFFIGEQLKILLGVYWILLYIIPIPFVLVFAYFTVNKNLLQKFNVNSVNLYPHKNPPSNAIKMVYTGSEVIKDLKVKVIYKDANGENQIKEVLDFFPEQDSQMIWRHYKYDHLKPNQVIYFRLPLIKTVPDKRVKVLVSFKDANSVDNIEIEKEFDLEH